MGRRDLRFPVVVLLAYAIPEPLKKSVFDAIKFPRAIQETCATATLPCMLVFQL